jgi:hypothetical protein
LKIGGLPGWTERGSFLAFRENPPRPGGWGWCRRRVIQVMTTAIDVFFEAENKKAGRKPLHEGLHGADLSPRKSKLSPEGFA